jgi:hypothetical protein
MRRLVHHELFNTNDDPEAEAKYEAELTEEQTEREQELTLTKLITRTVQDSGLPRERRLYGLMFAVIAHFHLDPTERLRELEEFVNELRERAHPDVGQQFFLECRSGLVDDGFEG